MKKLLKILLGVIAFFPLYAQAVNVTVPSAPALGSTLYGKANGNYATLTIGNAGECLKVAGGIPSWAACGTGGGSSFGEAWALYNSKSWLAPTTTVGIIVNASSTIFNLTSINSTTTNATTTSFWTADMFAYSSGGINVHAINGTNVAQLGAGSSANSLFYGGVNIDGATRLATSLNGLLTTTAGVVTNAIAGTDYISPAIRDWSVQGVGYLAPTTTRGIIVNSSSTISDLTVNNGTTTNATTTNLIVSNTASIPALKNLTSNGFVKTGGAVGTLSIDTNTYLTANQTITLSNDCTGSGATSISVFCAGFDRLSYGTTYATTVNATTTPTWFKTTLYSSSTASVPSVIDNIVSTNGTTTNATSTNLYISGTTRIASLNGILKGTTGLVGTAANGTDYTLITALTCTGSDKVSAITAAGVITCSTDQTGGASFGKAWEISNGFLSPTTTISIVVPNGTGNNGFGTTSPWGYFSIGNSVGGTEPLFVIASSSGALATTTNFRVDQFGRTVIGTSTPTINDLLIITGQMNSYVEGNVQNLSSGGSASSDWVATNDIGGDSKYYIDFGINSSGYNNTNYSITGPNDGYLYTNDGALAIGTASTTNTNAVLKFHTGGTTYDKERMRITQTGEVGIASTSPWAKLSIGSHNLALTSPIMAIASSSTGVATSTQFIWINGNYGIGTSSPWTGLTLGTGNGSSTKAITVTEHRVATSTSQTIDWKNGNQQVMRIGLSAITVTFTNYTDGQTLKLLICNPGLGTAGAITWPASSLLLWAGGTTPTQTTTANKCDVWSFIATQATSSLRIFGAQTASF